MSAKIELTYQAHSTEGPALMYVFGLPDSPGHPYRVDLFATTPRLAYIGRVPADEVPAWAWTDVRRQMQADYDALLAESNRLYDLWTEVAP